MGVKDKKKDKHGKDKSKHDKKKHKVKEDAEDDFVVATASPKKRAKKEANEPEVWKWWEEDHHDNTVKWKFLEHKGPSFPPGYDPLPTNVRFFYDGKHVKLSETAEEVATFYAKMLDHEYTSKDVFNRNFFNDWREVMTKDERKLITDLKKCNFSEIAEHFKQLSEQRKNMTKEEKQAIKEENEKLVAKFGFCNMDNHKEKVGNFRIEPPGLFRGRGNHPKMGKLKKRVRPEDIIINCSADSKAPPPPEGHRWKEVRHDNTVTWLASWTENIAGQNKYVMLAAASKMKSQKDWQKYEKARKLHSGIDTIRTNYRADWKSKEMRVRQRATALYLIDRLALRAGNEKDDDEADTVGCCSLRVEHVKLYEEMDGKKYVVEFDFLGKDSIRYYNAVAVEKRVWKNLTLFMKDKGPDDDLFDRLNTTLLNAYLHSLMDGLSAKVFRTYNASITLERQLKEMTKSEMSVAEKLLAYNRANRAVAILCNHQRAVPKTHEKSMQNLGEKIEKKKEELEKAQKELKTAKHDRDDKGIDKAKKAVARFKEQLMKLELSRTDRDENKTIALGTSKLNYLDPRISVAWCKKWDVPIEKIFNKTQREKFKWAIDMANSSYRFSTGTIQDDLLRDERERKEQLEKAQAEIATPPEEKKHKVKKDKKDKTAEKDAKAEPTTPKSTPSTSKHTENKGEPASTSKVKPEPGSGDKHKLTDSAVKDNKAKVPLDKTPVVAAKKPKTETPGAEIKSPVHSSALSSNKSPPPVNNGSAKPEVPKLVVKLGSKDIKTEKPAALSPSVDGKAAEKRPLPTSPKPNLMSPPKVVRLTSEPQTNGEVKSSPKPVFSSPVHSTNNGGTPAASTFHSSATTDGSTNHHKTESSSQSSHNASSSLTTAATSINPDGITVNQQ